MSEAGIYVLTKAILGGVSALMTGPFGSLDLPPGSIERALTSERSGFVIELVAQGGDRMGRVDTSRGGSPGDSLLHESFVPGLIATEDARFHEHPGVDPFAILAALTDRGEGRIRGGSTLTQQAVKNELIGNSRTLERKVLEAIVSVRAVHGVGRDRILDGYLARSWFGRGAFGAVSAPRAWFDRTWDEIGVSESAMLIGLLKGPGRYDPSRNLPAATARRDAVIGRMLAERVITQPEADAARAEPIRVESAGRDRPDPWVEAAVLRELRTGPLPPSDQARATLTISPAWQAITQEAVSWGAERIDGTGPAGVLPESLMGADPARVRDAMARHVDASPEIGRALVTGTGPLRVLIDRGFGPLEPESGVSGPAAVRVGEVYAYRREADGVRLVPSPRVNAAAVVMDARSGAILASVGGADPDLSRFDRSVAQRQVGSALKPFLWARALEAGFRPDELVSDTRASYMTVTGEVWSPQNYDRQETGWIPLFVALEESSNNVAARLVDQLGTRALAEITEAAGVYPPGGMRPHPSSALGASETTLVAMAAGYASIANGGVRVTPHTHLLIESNGEVLFPEAPPEAPVMTRGTADLISSMLYGVTVRGTAARAFGQNPPIAGKTGTTQSHRDAWFVGFTPDLVIAVWVGRDDNTSLPVRTTGSSAAAPIVARILDAAQRDGLTSGKGRISGMTELTPWPPTLLQAGVSRPAPLNQDGALVFEPDPEARRRAIEAGADPFKNPQDLFDRIRSEPEPTRPAPEVQDIWGRDVGTSRPERSGPDWEGSNIFDQD